MSTHFSNVVSTFRGRLWRMKWDHVVKSRLDPLSCSCWLVFITETECIYFSVRAGSLDIRIIQVSAALRALTVLQVSAGFTQHCCYGGHLGFWSETEMCTVGSAVRKGWTDFSKLQKPPRNSRHRKGNMKPIPYWVPTVGDLAGRCACESLVRWATVVRWASDSKS